MVGAAPIDRYVVLEHLSEGGMGAIYVGKKLGAGGFEMEVVLKQLLPEFTQQEEFIDLFLREAKLSATLDHANIVHTIDLVTAGGEYFIVMEYLPGGDLRTLIKRAKRRGKRFSPSAAIRISREVLSALAYAHVKRDFSGNPLKLIHRDVSPSNILVSYTGEVKLTDFGIAKAATHNSLFYKVKGKIGYMSPEQAKSEPLDHRSDLYSLAVCLYEVITGERLFVHAGLTTSADEIYSQPVPKVSRKVPGIPPDLDAIIERALAIDPNKRFQTAGELNEALTRCAHRNQLLMAAPELAQELLVACGDTSQWRNEDEGDDDDELGYAKRPGTEVYDIADDEDEDDVGPMSIHALAAKIGKPRLPTPATPDRPKTEVNRFQGVELTSIINMIDLEPPDGAKPLVDLLDSGPARVFDSEPRSIASLESAPRQAPSRQPAQAIPPTTSMRPMGALRATTPSSGPGMAPPDDMMPTAPRSFTPGPPPNPYPNPPQNQRTMQGLPPMSNVQQGMPQQQGMGMPMPQQGMGMQGMPQQGMQPRPQAQPQHQSPPGYGYPQPQHPHNQQHNQQHNQHNHGQPGQHGQHQQAPYPGNRPQQAQPPRTAKNAAARGKRSSATAWIIIFVILIAAGFATFFIATSGPDVAVQGK